ncbi:hypothetical protein Tco_1051517, partial [Tanacetum coccineum]
MTPATTTSSLLENFQTLPRLFGFDHRLKALEDTVLGENSGKPINIADALSSFLATVSGAIIKGINTSHAVAANLSELELKRILIDKMEANNSINRWGNDDEEPSAGTDRGSKRRRSGKEPASTSAPSETTTKTAGQTTSAGTTTHTKSASQSAPVGDAMHSTDVFKGPADQEFETGVQDEQAEEEVQHLPDWFQKPTRQPSPDHAWNTSVPAVHESVQPWISNLAQQDPRESFDELTDSTFDFSAFVLNRLNVQTLTPELLAGPTFELMKGTCKSLTELEYFCEELRLVPNITSVVEKYQYQSLHQQRPGISDVVVCQAESTLRQKRRLRPARILDRSNGKKTWCLTSMWKSNDIRRDDDLLYKFKEANFHRLRIQDIEDMLLLLVKEKSNLRRHEAYTPYSDPRGFIYENKDKKNRLMRLDELHKFSDGTLDDVQTALNDRLKEAKDKEDNEELGKRFVRWTTLRGYKAVRLRFSDPMIQPEPEGSTQGYPLDSVEVLRFNTSAGNPVKKILLKLNLSDHRLCKMVVEVPDSSWLTVDPHGFEGIFKDGDG